MENCLELLKQEFYSLWGTGTSEYEYESTFHICTLAKEHSQTKVFFHDMFTAGDMNSIRNLPERLNR